MANIINSTYLGAIQSYTQFVASNKLSDVTCLKSPNEDTQTAGQVPQYDTLELSQEQSQVTLDVPDQITSEIPRAWTIMGETFESWNNHLQSSLDKADTMNLSFGDRLTFLKEQSRIWVEDKRQNDPEMFTAWLQLHKDDIQKGEADLVGLPSNFTIKDYNSYVKEPFSTLA